MNETRDLLERVGGRFSFPDRAFERMLRRRERKERNKRIGTITVVAVLMAALSVGVVKAERWARPVPESHPPGTVQDGRIAFVSSSGDVDQLFTAAPDGSDLHLLEPSQVEYPDWSPDASTVAYDDGSVTGFPDWIGQPAHIYTVQADGTGGRQITSGAGSEFTPEWSPDGAHIVVTAIEPGETPGIFVVDPGTGDMTAVTSNPYPGHLDKEPGYSPDGSEIVFVRERSLVDAGDPTNSSALFVVNVDGTGLRRLTPWMGLVGTPSWSPVGNRIVFRVARGAWRAGSVRTPAPQIFTVRSDGTGLTQLTFSKRAGSFWPSWSPDGSMIVFMRARVFPGMQLVTMLPDGSHVTVLPLPKDTGWYQPDWGTHP